MIKKFLNYFQKNSLISGSFIVLIGATIGNFGSYLFHLAMGRLLGPADYGILASLISLSYYLGIPVSVLTTVVVKFASQNSKNKEKVSLFIKKLSRKITPYNLGALLIFLLFFPLLKVLIKVDSFVLFFGLGIASFFSVYVTVFSAALQGIMKFFAVGILTVLSSWSRLTMAVAAVLLGTRVNGAVYAGFFSVLLCLAIGHRLLKKYLFLDSKGEISIKDSFVNLPSYSLAILLSNLTLTSFFTVDIILARFFLSPVEAGQYASLSVLGKIIYFAGSPVISVMFPMISERQANGGNFQKLLWGSLLMVAAISFLICLAYFLFPRQMIMVLFGDEYLGASSNLFWFAIFVAIYSFCSLLMNFYLSVSKTKIIYLGLLFVILQVVLISFRHKNILQIITVNIVTLLLFLFCLLVYYAQTFLWNKSKT